MDTPPTLARSLIIHHWIAKHLFLSLSLLTEHIIHHGNSSRIEPASGTSGKVLPAVAVFHGNVAGSQPTREHGLQPRSKYHPF